MSIESVIAHDNERLINIGHGSGNLQRIKAKRIPSNMVRSSVEHGNWNDIGDKISDLSWLGHYKEGEKWFSYKLGGGSVTVSKRSVDRFSSLTSKIPGIKYFSIYDYLRTRNVIISILNMDNTKAESRTAGYYETLKQEIPEREKFNEVRKWLFYFALQGKGDALFSKFTIKNILKDAFTPLRWYQRGEQRRNRDDAMAIIKDMPLSRCELLIDWNNNSDQPQQEKEKIAAFLGQLKSDLLNNESEKKIINHLIDGNNSASTIKAIKEDSRKYISNHLSLENLGALNKTGKIDNAALPNLIKLVLQKDIKKIEVGKLTEGVKTAIKEMSEKTDKKWYQKIWDVLTLKPVRDFFASKPVLANTYMHHNLKFLKETIAAHPAKNSLYTNESMIKNPAVNESQDLSDKEIKNLELFVNDKENTITNYKSFKDENLTKKVEKSITEEKGNINFASEEWNNEKELKTSIFSMSMK